MLHKLFGLSSILVVLLAVFATPGHCVRGRIGLHASHHAHLRLHGRFHGSKTIADPNNIVNIQMVTDKEDQSSTTSEPNKSMWAPGGHKANTNKNEVRSCPGDKSNINIGMPAHMAHSLDTIGTPNSASMSKPKTSMWATPTPTPNKRSLLDPSSNSADHALQGGEDLNLFFPSVTIREDHNLFSMLPRGAPAPPSGPSKSHNSMLTDKPS